MSVANLAIVTVWKTRNTDIFPKDRTTELSMFDYIATREIIFVVFSFCIIH